MDHQAAIRRLRSPRLLRLALAYALFDRTRSDWFYDPIEVEHALASSQDLIGELAEELQSPGNYSPRIAFAYFAPKNELCDRRMVYVPIKDLTLRYALAILFAEEIETEIHPQCFANRRTIGDEAKIRFTQDFATGGWANFCAWQREESHSRSVLLRTDISAFYDSVSHEYLVQAVCRHLSLPPKCPLIQLFRKLLKIKVIYYSPANNHVEGPAVMHQGLPIGDGVEGFLANILLKDLDDAMATANATYGRYVDDMRLFGNSPQEVHHRLRILQEQLLRMGLNLNSSKTTIAENREQLEHLMSQNYGMADYGEDELVWAGLEIQAKVDQPFEAFSRVFSEEQELKSCSEAKDFCKYLSANDFEGDPLVPIGKRQLWHLRRLREVIVRSRGPCKHAAWLLVQTAVYRGVPARVQRAALATVLELLESEETDPYSRYRVLHHLLKRREWKTGPGFRFVDNLPRDERVRVRALVPSLLKAPAFELNLIGLYLAKETGRSIPKLRQLVKRYAMGGCEPLRNALAAIADELPEAVLTGSPEREADEMPESY